MTEENKILITESTKKVIEDELNEKIEDLSDNELLKIVNESKTVVATQEKDGNIKIRQVLNG
jgi:uncharacterized membrane protein